MLGLPIGILGGLYLAESRDRRLPWLVRFLADVLNGVPSIVVGIFAYTIIVLPMRRFSALAGGFALAVIMLPIVVRTTEELVRLVPASLREAGLGARHPGVEGAAARRPAGPRAPASSPASWWRSRGSPGRRRRCCSPRFGNRFWHQGLDQPIAALPLQIYAYAIAPYDDWHRQAWAGALVLIGAGIRGELRGPRRYERPLHGGKITHGRRNRRPRPQRMVRQRARACTGSA